MKRAKTSIRIAMACCAVIMLSGCSESEADRRTRLEAFNDELVSAGGSQDEITAKIAELNSEDRELLGEIAVSRASQAQDDFLAISNLTSDMQAKAASDPLRADQLVARCEAETGVSSSGKNADIVAKCVSENW